MRRDHQTRDRQGTQDAFRQALSTRNVALRGVPRIVTRGRLSHHWSPRLG